MSEKNLRRLKRVFYALIVIFILILLMTFMFPIISGVGGLIRASLVILTIISWLLFFSLGAILIFLTLKSKVEGKLKVFLLLTGISSACFLLFIILHNFVYGLFIYLFGEGFWNGGDEPVFFILAIFVCPIGFLIGAIGSIVLFKRKGGRHSPHRYVRN